MLNDLHLGLLSEEIRLWYKTNGKIRGSAIELVEDKSNIVDGGGVALLMSEFSLL